MPVMMLLLFRHGIADSGSPDGTDAARPLTDEGLEKTKLAAAGLVCVADRPQAILTSPKVRALQTARILAQQFDQTPVVAETLAQSDLRAVMDLLAQRHESVLMLVGHEPTLSDLTRALCFGSTEGSLELKKAGCACLQLPRDRTGDLRACAQLLWLATPKMLRRMA